MTPRLPLAALACLAVAGCGSSSSSGSAFAPAPAGDTVTIHMQNIQFNPKAQTVKVGQKIHWVNDDSVDHDVKADLGASFKSDQFGTGGAFDFTPKKAGEIMYECTLHPGMNGALEVV
jgi:plastocyanin